MDFPIVLGDDLFPVQAFFNAMSDRNLISTLEEFSKGIGAGFNDAVCEFPSELDPGDEPFEGVRFYIFEEEVILSKSDFMKILGEVCLIYAARHPSDEIRIQELVDIIAKRQDINDWL